MSGYFGNSFYPSNQNSEMEILRVVTEGDRVERRGVGWPIILSYNRIFFLPTKKDKSEDMYQYQIPSTTHRILLVSGSSWYFFVVLSSFGSFW